MTAAASLARRFHPQRGDRHLRRPDQVRRAAAAARRVASRTGLRAEVPVYVLLERWQSGERGFVAAGLASRSWVKVTWCGPG
jgi:hypothetical protein